MSKNPKIPRIFARRAENQRYIAYFVLEIIYIYLLFTFICVFLFIFK